MAPRREVGFSWHPTVSQGLSVARSPTLPQIRGCSPLMTRVPWRRRYKLVDAADHIGYEWTGRAHGSLADALATLAVQRWLEQWLVAE